MVLLVQFLEALARNVSIDLRGGYVGMAEQ
jgi:hypothetical protein